MNKRTFGSMARAPVVFGTLIAFGFVLLCTPIASASPPATLTTAVATANSATALNDVNNDSAINTIGAIDFPAPMLTSATVDNTAALVNKTAVKFDNSPTTKTVNVVQQAAKSSYDNVHAANANSKSDTSDSRRVYNAVMLTKDTAIAATQQTAIYNAAPALGVAGSGFEATQADRVVSTNLHVVQASNGVGKS